MRRQLKADRPIDPLEAKRGRGPLKQAKLATDCLADSSCRDARRNGLEKFATPSRALGLFGSGRGIGAGADTARLAGPINQIAVLVEHHGGAAKHRRLLAGEAAEPLPFKDQLLAPDILQDDLLGQRSAVARQLAGADDLGDAQVCV